MTKYERWKSTIDYAVRNLSVMDEEETRHFEDEETIQTYLKGFAEQGVPQDEVQKIEIYLRRLKKGGFERWQEYYELNEKIGEILHKYMSHKELFITDYHKWIELFWRQFSR